MKEIKKILVISLVFICLCLMTGCGDNQNGDDGVVEIELFNRKTQAVPVLEKIVKQFNDENPDIRIKLNTPTGSAQQGNDPFTVRVASKDVPDIFTEWPCLPEYVERARAGVMLDLTEQEFMNNIDQAILDKTVVDGKQYALSISLNTTGVVYNKKIFADNGWNIPTTYDELITLCKEMQQKNIRPFVFGDREAWTLGHPVQGLYYQSIPNTSEFWINVASGKTKAQNSKELKRVAEKVLELHKYGQEDYLGASYQTLIVDFATEEAAMMWAGNWVISGILGANPELDFGFFPFPADNAEDTALIAGVDFALSAAADTEHPEEVMRVLEYFAKIENAQLYADEDCSYSAIKGVENHTTQLEGLDLQAAIQQNIAGDWSCMAWGPGMESEMASVLQNLLTHEDVNKFMKEVDDLLKTAGPPEVRNK